MLTQRRHLASMRVVVRGNLVELSAAARAALVLSVARLLVDPIITHRQQVLVLLKNVLARARQAHVGHEFERRARFAACRSREVHGWANGVDENAVAD